MGYLQLEINEPNFEAKLITFMRDLKTMCGISGILATTQTH